jgi:hypothetical protein
LLYDGPKDADVSVELRYRKTDRSPLGRQSDVQDAIRRAVPTVQFYEEPSGAQKISSAAARGYEFPPELQAFLSTRPSEIQGDADLDGCFLRFFLGSEDTVTSFHVEIRGQGDVEAILANLAAMNDWLMEEFL